MRITVLGCGNGAFATAADMADKGHEVTLYVDSSHRKNFKVIEKTKKIICYGVGPTGPVEISKVTCDTEEALKNADLIISVIPAFAHEDVAVRIAPYIKDGDKVLLSPGSTGGALVFAKAFYEHGVAKDVRIAEIHTLPYTARKVGMDGVNISLMLDFMLFAAFPAKYNEEMYELIKPLYPNIELCRDVIETGLNNGNATTHPAPMVLNAGKVEYFGRHDHYAEGITPSVGNVIQLIDDERKLICREFGYKELDIKDRLYKMGYCPLKETVYDCIQGSTDVFLPIHGPNDLNDRYLTEDAPYSLVAMSELARVAGVKTPLMDSIVHLACALRSENYWETGRTLEKMGLEGMTKEETEEYIVNGKPGR